MNCASNVFGRMKYVLFLFLSYLLQVHCYYNKNPNNYFDFSIDFVREDLTKKIAQTYYDVIVLKVHVNINAQLVETSVNDESEKILKQQTGVTCQQSITKYKNNFHQECQMLENFDLLEITRSKFKSLNEVACQTLEICQLLNPLESQVRGLEKCLLSKITDLRQQTLIVSEEFQILKKKLFEDHDKCIRTTLSTAFSQLANIRYGENCIHLL